MTQSASISVSVSIDQAVAGDLSNARNNINLSPALRLLDGAGLGQASKAFSDKRTLAASANDSLDLAGVLVDAFGAIITFTKIKGIVIAAAATNTDTISVGGGSNPFASFFGDATDELVIRPGGLFLLTAPDAAGYTVTAATGDLLAIANNSASGAAEYDIILIGT